MSESLSEYQELSDTDRRRVQEALERVPDLEYPGISGSPVTLPGHTAAEVERAVSVLLDEAIALPDEA